MRPWAPSWQSVEQAGLQHNNGRSDRIRKATLSPTVLSSSLLEKTHCSPPIRAACLLDRPRILMPMGAQRTVLSLCSIVMSLFCIRCGETRSPGDRFIGGRAAGVAPEGFGDPDSSVGFAATAARGSGKPRRRSGKTAKRLVQRTRAEWMQIVMHIHISVYTYIDIDIRIHRYLHNYG